MDRRLFIWGTVGVLGFSGNAWAKAVSEKDAQTGLRDILTKGTQAAVERVSRPDGYWGDTRIQIPLPKTLAKTQKLLKPLGQSGLLDDLHLRMNRAAESAAPAAKGLFIDAIKGMTIKDAVGIINGGDTSGTQYLQRTATPGLKTAFTPPMQNAMQQTGAVDYLDRVVKRNNMQGFLKTDAKTYLGDYAVGLALQGLFYYVGSEEAAIRRDPAKRTTQILKAIFG
ncbi:DUF4197 domain-containing protein [Asticcacaulis sp. 201]|uniref:DUF4197 domain-containing protein n=1 Tax=Asticcacaulis sp. 201 TaxID=3028787 RepID=UPI0029166F89|nr:DUF4197 domain-containing protein [Asticcacaulis sp. 201]MDV6332339.1 DUF4197 domain-containing protein [Asticcacaulis sp. 201]